MAKRKERTPSAAPIVSPRKTRSYTTKMVKEAAGVTREDVAAAPSLAKNRKVTKTKEKVVDDVVLEKQAPVASGEKKTVIIEACKQCQSFKRTSFGVKDGLEKQMPEANVIINPEKPRRGCFEVRGANGDVFISLLDMKRPFTPMKQLNLVEVVAEIVEKLKQLA